DRALRRGVPRGDRRARRRARREGPPMKARARLVALRVRAVLARALAHAVMRVLPPHAQSLVAGLPDSEENSLVTAIALARRTRGRVLLVANDPAHARE